MHDIDRTMGRTNMEAFELEGEDELGEFQAEGEGEGEGVYEADMEAEGYAGEGEEELVGEDELDELTSELLEVNSEAELDRFLGKLVRNVGQKVGTFVRSPVGQQLGGALKQVAKQLLPVAGQAIGNRIAPGVGGDVGRAIGTGAGQLLGLELEGLSHEDRDFEIAKQFVRLAADAAQAATQAPAAQNAAAAARQAITEAAQRYAPGLLGGRTSPGPGPGGGQQGTWVRRGSTIVIYGA